MKIIDMDGQLLSEERDAFGIILQEALEEHHVKCIKAGTVMVAKFSGHFQILFEVGCDLTVSKLKGASFMYPENGSKVPLMLLTHGVTMEMIWRKTILFRDCRLPSSAEYNKYLLSETI